MKRVIITGATGAIGIALVNELIKNGVEVLVFCHTGSKRIKNIPVHPLVSLKYCSLNELADVKNDTGKIYDVFYHFAWEGTTGAARNDMYMQNTNVRFALDAVNAAKRFGCNTFIGAGSQAEYGRSNKPLTSATPVFPENGYGIAKLCAGQMTRELTHQNDMRHIWVRVLSVYGPHDSAQSMVMSTIDKLQKGETPQFTKGEQMWDYLYSEDAAKAFYLLSEKGIDGKTYVLGSGQARQLKEYIKDIRDVFSPYTELDFGTIPYGEKQVMYLVGDISELNKDINWIPTISFYEGIQRIMDKTNGL